MLIICGSAIRLTVWYADDCILAIGQSDEECLDLIKQADALEEYQYDSVYRKIDGSDIIDLVLKGVNV